ncbi:MAG: 2Fe-2S iron-sulfur cluster-binding protein, partial [Myxococcota bacterium]|nr:2Fe-2S iron-sulfur cluster-binding protein [Myxococcota bacterium]
VGHEIRTIEGVANGATLHPLQVAFIDHGAIQCGFCTPGMVLSGMALLEANPDPTEAEIRVAISGNLCRCTGYQKIVEAVADAADALGRDRPIDTDTLDAVSRERKTDIDQTSESITTWAQGLDTGGETWSLGDSQDGEGDDR